MLSDPTNAVLAGGEPTLTATGVILDNDGTDSDRALFVSDPEILETDTGTQAVFEVRISEPSSTALSFAYSTADGTALAGEDYTATSGTVTFAPGQTVASVTVDVTGDTSIETQETFSLVVTPNSAIANGVDDAAGVAMIIDDDTTTDLPVISISSAEADEGDLAIFTVTLSEPSPFADVTVQFLSLIHI